MTVEQAAEAGLKRMRCRYLRDPQDGAFVAPIPMTDSSLVLVGIHTQEDPPNAIIEAELCRVPAASRAAVALHLCELNGKYKFVCFSMINGIVRADVSVELSFANDPEALIVLSIVRLITAIEQQRDGILRAFQKRSGSLSKAERQVASIVSKRD